ncbi:MAG: tetratricopeptide repeat protein [Flavobacteriales bacterium]|nr:tetratricopeptide repeat protein [Flavobacteriales bacterium]
MNQARKHNFANWRAVALLSVWGLFAIHFIHWKLNGTTLAPLELNEVLYTIHQGIITGGFILMFVVMIATLFLGRFFCGWACHILSLQDGCAWLMKKIGVKPQAIRSRFFIWVPLGAVFYLFVWPQIAMYFGGIEVAKLHVAKADSDGWSSFVTDDLWRNLPSGEIALSTFFIVGFLIIYLLGSRSFCFYGCPYGALFSIADRVSPGRIILTGDCVQCGVCTSNCGSDILVHKEIKKYEMVTNDRCLKCLDCVGGCPEQALSFGFTKPPLFKKISKLEIYKERYNFTLWEDISMAIIFILSVLIFRALYDLIPFLMSIGLSVVTAYLSIIFYRTLTNQSSKIRRTILKISHRITPIGYTFITFCICYFTLIVHSAFIQFHSFRGQKIYESVITDRSSTRNPQKLEKALIHFELADDFGLITPLRIKKQIASIHLFRGEDRKAIPFLKELVEEIPEDIESIGRLSVIYMKQKNFYDALPFLQKLVELQPQNPKSHYNLGMANMSIGNYELAVIHLKRAIKINPSYEKAKTGLSMISNNRKDISE